MTFIKYDYVYIGIEAYIGTCPDHDSFCVSLLDKAQKVMNLKMEKLDFHFGGEPSVYKKKEKNYFPLVYAFLQEDEIQS